MRILIILLLFPFAVSASCFDELQSLGWVVKAEKSPEGFCSIKNPVRLYETDTTVFSPSVLLSCSTARDVGMWAKEISAKRVDNVGGYVCRNQRSSVLLSQHSFGKAIDIVAIDGIPISQKWQSAYKAGCKFFNTVLTPKHDALHQNHLHMDNGYGYSCIFDIVR